MTVLAQLSQLMINWFISFTAVCEDDEQRAHLLIWRLSSFVSSTRPKIVSKVLFYEPTFRLRYVPVQEFL